MKAAWYEKQGPAREVLVVGEMPEPQPGPGEVRIRIAASGINPGDIKKRQDSFGIGMAYPRVIPHSDGAGKIDQVGDGVSPEWVGRSVWCYGAQSYRAFGTAAEFTVVPLDHVAPLPYNVSPDAGACLGIPGITAHRAVFVTGAVRERTVLVQGAGGAVGMCAVQLARRGGARVIGTVRSSIDEPAARAAGAHEVVLNGPTLPERVKVLASDGVDHIVEVAFGANIDTDVGLLKMGGSIASYATDNTTPKIPFWQMVFKNIRVYFLGSDDFPTEAKVAATRDINDRYRRVGRDSRLASDFPYQRSRTLTNSRNIRCGAGGLWLRCKRRLFSDRIQLTGNQRLLAASRRRRAAAWPLVSRWVDATQRPKVFCSSGLAGAVRA